MRCPAATCCSNSSGGSEPDYIVPDAIAYRQGGQKDDSDAFESTVTFTDRSGRTEITLRAVFNSKAQRDYLAENYRAVEGGQETLERLEEYVRELGSAGS